MSDNTNTVEADLEVITSVGNVRQREFNKEQIEALQTAVSLYEQATHKLRTKSSELVHRTNILMDRTEQQQQQVNRAITFYESKLSHYMEKNRILTTENSQLRTELAQLNNRLLNRAKKCMVCFDVNMSVTNYCTCTFEMCTECVVNMFESQRGHQHERFKCPMCRKDMNANNCGISKLTIIRNAAPIPNYDSDIENALVNVRDAFQTGERIIQNDNEVPETTINFPELTDIIIRGTREIQERNLNNMFERQTRTLGAAMNAAARLFGPETPPGTPPRTPSQQRPPTPYYS